MNSAVKKKYDFPQVDLPSNILAWDNVNEELLTLYKQACKLQAVIFALCIKGTMRVSINLIEYKVEEGDLLTLYPGTIIQFHEALTPLQISFSGFSSKIVGQVNFMELSKNSYIKIKEKPVIKLDNTTLSYLSKYFSLLTNITNDETTYIESTVTPHILTTIASAVNSIYESQPNEPVAENRQEEICRELLLLIVEHYTKERTAQFYAKQLEITPQHLSTTVKQVTGKTVIDLIADVVIMDAKAKLKSTDLSILEIGHSLNFRSSSFFSKYFKRHVGVSPIEYKQKQQLSKKTPETRTKLNG